jgi:hypothetical protein
MTRHEEDSVPLEPRADAPPSEPLPASPQEETPARKKWQTAPWPHPMTYVLGLLSPALAAVALYVSWSSLSLSREALRVSQRAYLAGDATASFDLDRNLSVGRIKVESTLANAGNTPATLLDVNVGVIVPSGWTLVAPAAVGAAFHSLRLQRSESYRSGRDATFSLSATALEPLASFSNATHLVGDGIFQVVVHARYRDEFDSEEEFSWCWEYWGDGRLRKVTCDALAGTPTLLGRPRQPVASQP